jgi:SAM-dependent methyltransferase
VLARLEREERSATALEREALAAWSSWGAVPELFDETRAEWAGEREQLHELVGEHGYVAARRTTINAHYTHPLIARAMWKLASELGFEGGRVLEPGCGAGVFIGLAPSGADMVGVELDDTTAAIAQELHPDARIIARSFAQYQPRGTFDLVIGNVPFADVRLYDPVHNRQQHSIHNHFIVSDPRHRHDYRQGGRELVLALEGLPSRRCHSRHPAHRCATRRRADPNPRHGRQPCRRRRHSHRRGRSPIVAADLRFP